LIGKSGIRQPVFFVLFKKMIQFSVASSFLDPHKILFLKGEIIDITGDLITFDEVNEQARLYR
jgi:hypothetical protein